MRVGTANTADWRALDSKLALSATRPAFVGYDLPFDLLAALPHTAETSDLDPIRHNVPAPANASHVPLIIVHVASVL